MKEKMLQDVKQYKEQNQRKRIWRRIVRVLACVVVFCTTYALILPAITMEKNTCGMTEHAHSENCYERVTSETVAILACDYESLAVHEHTADCYDAENCLVCGQADYLVHTHSQACLDENGAVVCRIPERREHEHTEDCYRVEETESAAEETIHTHGDECYTVERGELTCQQAETAGHSHGEACFAQEELVCQLTEEEAHTHDASCYESQLMCELSEEPEHWHTDECYEMVSTLTCPLEEEVSEEETVPAEPVLICEKEEIKLHSHDEEDCYETYLDAEGNEQKRLVCTKLVVLEHKHAENCYVTEEVPLENADALTCTLTEGHTHAEDCYDETGALICAEEENHTHSDLCYGTWVLICDQEEHTHTDECRAADGGEETTAPIDSAEGLKGTLTKIETEIINPDQGISLMSQSADLVPPTLMPDSTTVTWELSLSAVGEPILRFDTNDGQPHEMEDYTGGVDSGPTPWADAISRNNPNNKPVHVVFSDNVTSIGKHVLQRLYIGSIEWGGVTRIGHQSFILGSGPAVVTIPEQIRHVDSYAFQERTGIKSFVIEGSPDSVSKGMWIGTRAFYTKNDIEEVHIHSRVTKLDGGAPKARVSEYTVSEDNPNYYVEDGVLFSKATSTYGLPNALIDYPVCRQTSEYRIPEGIEAVSSRAFGSAQGISKLVIPASVTYLGELCFEQASIGEIYIEDYSNLETVEKSDRNHGPLEKATGLTNIRYPENMEEGKEVTLLDLLDKDTEYPRYTHFTIPKVITEIGNLDGQLPNLETVTYNAAKATITGTKFFDSCSKYKLVIGKDVDQINSDFQIIVENAEGLYFEKKPDGSGFYENWFEASNVSTNLGKPLELLNGKLYVDANGVLYELIDDDATARVLYVSRDCPESITIPAILNAKNQYGETYTVIGVQADAFCCAENLKHVVFDNPGNITELSNYAMANCPTLESVNGETTKAGAEALFTNLGVMVEHLFDNTGLEDSIGGLDYKGQKTLFLESSEITAADMRIVADSNKDWVENEDGTGYYRKLTGNVVTLSAYLDNQPADDQNKYRLYFRTNGDWNPLPESFKDGESITFTANSQVVGTAVYYTTNDSNVSYLEFSTVTGATVGIPIKLYYPSPQSGGGSVVVWGTILTDTEADANVRKVVAPATEGQTIQAQWVTERAEYKLDKAGVNELTIVGGTKTDSNGELISYGKPESQLVWTLQLKADNEADPSEYGNDYIKSAVFTDIITLPEGFAWSEEMVSALSSGPVAFKQNKAEEGNETNPRYIDDLYIGDMHAIRVSRRISNVNTTLMEAYLEDNKLVIRWEMTTGNSDREIDLETLNVEVYPETINIDMAKATEANDFTIRNEATVELEYNYSGSDFTSDDASTRLTGGAAERVLTKTYVPPADGAANFGEPVKYTIELSNTGAMPFDEFPKGKIVYIADSLSPETYLTPDEMQSMLMACEPGDLTISIKNPTITTTIVEGNGTKDNPGSVAEVKGWEPVTGAFEGTSAYLTPQNSNIGTKYSGYRLRISRVDGSTFMLQIQKDYSENGVVTDTPTLNGGTFTDLSVAALLQKIGYGVTRDDMYRVEWAIHTDTEQQFVLYGGESLTYELNAKYKDTFMHFGGTDWQNNYPTGNPTSTVTNWVANNYKDPGVQGEKAEAGLGAKVISRLWRECEVSKAVYAGDTLLEGQLLDNYVISNGEVLTYQAEFINRGRGDYENLPFVDQMYGCQYLLVPKELNSNLDGMGLDTAKDANGTDCYILKPRKDANGNYVPYENVKVGVAVAYDQKDQPMTPIQLIAHSIMVKPVTDTDPDVELPSDGTYITYSGIQTTITWYFPTVSELEGTDMLRIRYDAVVDFDLCEDSKYVIGNGIWVNDRQGSRIYDYVGKGGTIIEFDKDIVTEKREPSGDDIIDEDDVSLVAQGNKVCYRLTLHNTNDGEFNMNGLEIVDVLPETYGLFEWTAGDNGNVELSGIVTERLGSTSGADSGITFDRDLLENGWRIETDLETGRQKIVWPEELKIRFTKESNLYLYFTLTYPADEDLWSQYVAKADGRPITNSFVVYTFPTEVAHDLVSEGEVLLQKGVSGMYHYGIGEAYQDDPTYHKAGSYRVAFNNTDVRKRAVHYYVTIYNGGAARLYLDDLYDKLPKGFTFKQMMSIQPLGVTASFAEKLNMEVTPNENKLIEITSGFGEEATYIPVNVTPAKLGDNAVKFTISNPHGGNLKKDEVSGKYYLARGEYIVFGYMCDIGTATDTEDYAENIIAMPYDDYLGAGVTESDIRVKGDPSNIFMDKDDGDSAVGLGLVPDDELMEVRTNEDVVAEYGQYGFESHEGQKWLESNVTVKRGEIVPGIFKQVNNANGIVDPYESVSWSVTLKNDGTQALSNYIFEDILPAPFSLEGTVQMEIFDASDYLIKTYDICTINGRNTPNATGYNVSAGQYVTVKIPNGSTKTIQYNGVLTNIDGQSVQMSIGPDGSESANEVLRIRINTSSLSIPEGGSAIITLLSSNQSGSVENTSYHNRAFLYPVQVSEFDPEDVKSGSVVYENDKAIGVENYATVTVAFGYGTTSEKQVSEDANPSNTVSSKEKPNNSIVLRGADGTITYKLIVNNPNDKAMTKLVVIDNLPQIGDRLPLKNDFERHSEFSVFFVNEPFQVNIISQDGMSTLLDPESYTLQFSDATEFDNNDWIGIDNANKWQEVNPMSPNPTNDHRSFRLIITDDIGEKIPGNSTIEISFKAKPDSKAPSNTIAWNSFGYHYGLLGVTEELRSSPEPVGVSMPRAPFIQKELLDQYGRAYTTDEKRIFSFIYYEGDAITIDERTGASLNTVDELCRVLNAKGIKYSSILQVSVQANKSSGKMTADLSKMNWTDGKKYTLVEYSGPEEFGFYRYYGGEGGTVASRGDLHQYTFTYHASDDPRNPMTVTCVNKLKDWEINLTKVNPEKEVLPGAVFALYSPNQSEWGSPADGVDHRYVYNGRIWYLMSVAETDANGALSWTGLKGNEYFILEIKAPDGYRLPLNNGMIVTREGTESIHTVVVTNQTGYELPETGGTGTTSYTLGGLLIATAAILMYTHILKRRKEDYTSF